jgi:hypothetical protein
MRPTAAATILREEIDCAWLDPQGQLAHVRRVPAHPEELRAAFAPGDVWAIGCNPVPCGHHLVAVLTQNGHAAFLCGPVPAWLAELLPAERPLDRASGPIVLRKRIAPASAWSVYFTVTLQAGDVTDAWFFAGPLTHDAEVADALAQLPSSLETVSAAERAARLRALLFSGQVDFGGPRRRVAVA